MPQYCSAGQSARVFFQYPDGTKDNISVANCPVDVEVKTLPSTPGQNPSVCYKVSYRYQHQSPPRSAGSSPWYWFYTCGPVSYRQGKSTTPGSLASIFFTVPTYAWNLITCPVGSPATELENDNFTIPGTLEVEITRADGQQEGGAGQCQFKVVDATGKTLFEKTSTDCPTYQVACGTNCPDGQIECGGKCVPCEELAGQIKPIINAIRGFR